MILMQFWFKVIKTNVDPYVCRRSVEFSLKMKEIFEAAVLTELFPQSVIDIYVEVLQSDGGKEEF